MVNTSTFQEELNDVRGVWNSHSIQKGHNHDNTVGKPLLLYTIPEYYGKQNCLCVTERADVRICDEEIMALPQSTCEDTVYDLCLLLMEDNNWIYPTNAEDGIELYLNLRRTIRNHI